jgi:hypothetical protein
MDDLSQFSDTEILAATLIGESESKGHDYMVGTACTIVNRAKADLHWMGGDTLRGVCLQPSQYDVWDAGADRDRVIQIATQNPLYGPYVDALGIAGSAIDGTLQDITNGAVSYYDSDACACPNDLKGKAPCFTQGARFYFGLATVR